MERIHVIEQPQSMDTLRLLGGVVGLDFANTVDPRHSSHPHEYLTSYADLVAWGCHAGVLTEGEAHYLWEDAVRRPAEASDTFARAIALREAIYRVYSAVAHGARPATPDLALLHRMYVAALTHAGLVPTVDGVAWAWGGDAEALDRMLWPVARSAVELLTADDVGRVKECPGSDGCSWLFLDMSKNGSRRWCSMEGCGSRVKMRRHYTRHHGKAAMVQAHPER